MFAISSTVAGRWMMEVGRCVVHHERCGAESRWRCRGFACLEASRRSAADPTVVALNGIEPPFSGQNSTSRQ
ncbi:hypothetical protein AMC87_PD00871 (plasmid) [Rhizobium phaseoli]|nr:hypothetical protein AMC87_PD00871 [Rhizobium phaseoli]